MNTNFSKRRQLNNGRHLQKHESRTYRPIHRNLIVTAAWFKKRFNSFYRLMDFIVLIRLIECIDIIINPLLPENTGIGRMSFFDQITVSFKF